MAIHEVISPVNGIWIEEESISLSLTVSYCHHPQFLCVFVINAVYKYGRKKLVILVKVCPKENLL